MLEPWLTILAALVILGYGRLGAMFGLFYELPNTLMLLFASLISLRYWYLATGLVQSFTHLSGSLAAVIAFWALLVISCAPMILLVRRLSEDAQPIYPQKLQAVLGFLLGIVSATIFVCCLATSLSVFVPKVWSGYDRTTMHIPWDEMPMRIYQRVEQQWFHIGPDDPSHTRLPTFAVTIGDDPDTFWQ